MGNVWFQQLRHQPILEEWEEAGELRFLSALVHRCVILQEPQTSLKPATPIPVERGQSILVDTYAARGQGAETLLLRMLARNWLHQIQIMPLLPPLTIKT